MIELKPCPFCGAAAEIETAKDPTRIKNSYVLIRCTGCGVLTKTFLPSIEYSAIELAVETWNRRI